MGELFTYAFWMQKQGYRPSITRSSISTLKAVAKKANLLNQDAAESESTIEYQ